MAPKLFGGALWLLLFLLVAYGIMRTGLAIWGLVA